MCLHIYWDTWSHKKALAFSNMYTHMYIYISTCTPTHTHIYTGRPIHMLAASQQLHTHMIWPPVYKQAHAYTCLPLIHTQSHTHTCIHTHTCSPSACTPPPPPPTHWYTHVIGCTHSHLSPQLYALMHLTACLCTQNQIPASLHRHIPVCLKIPTHMHAHTHVLTPAHPHTPAYTAPSPPPPPYTHTTYPLQPLHILHKEAIGVVPGQEHVLHHVPHTLLLEAKVLSTHSRGVDEVQPEGISAKLVGDFHGVRVVLLPLAHLLAISARIQQNNG